MEYFKEQQMAQNDFFKNMLDSQKEQHLAQNIFLKISLILKKSSNRLKMNLRQTWLILEINN
jgi:hypothetical protein